MYRKCKSLTTSVAHEMYWELFLARLAAYGVGFVARFSPIDMYFINLFLVYSIKYDKVGRYSSLSPTAKS